MQPGECTPRWARYWMTRKRRSWRVARAVRRTRQDFSAEREALGSALREINLARRAAGDERADHLRQACLLLQIASSEERPPTEDAFEALLGHPSTRLAVYGSLAPGEQNHWVLSHLAGEWSRGSVRGVLHAEGWGACDGFPGMEWIPTAGEIPVLVFTSDDLTPHWARIDAFEGGDYRRILIPVDLDAGGLVVANIYELRREP